MRFRPRGPNDEFSSLLALSWLHASGAAGGRRHHRAPGRIRRATLFRAGRQIAGHHGQSPDRRARKSAGPIPARHRPLSGHRAGTRRFGQPAPERAQVEWALPQEGCAARSLGQSLRVQATRRTQRLRHPLLRQGRPAGGNRRKRRHQQPLGRPRTMRFELKAVSPDGRVESLDLHGLDQASAVQQAESRGYTVLGVRARAGFGAPWRGAHARFPLVLFSQELLVLLKAGLPLVESIETLAERERRSEFRALLERVGAILRQGNSLSSALQQFPLAFPPLYVSTVQASERTSDLAPALARYVAYQNQLEAIRKRLVNAAIYPALLIGVGGLVSLFLLIYVVPRFSRIYEERSVDLPFFSKLLLSWGQLVEGHGGLVMGVLAGLAIAAVYALRNARVKARIDNALWRLPAIGERLKLYQLARFYRTIGMLLRGGTPLPTALQMGAELLHPLLRARLAAASRAVREGRPVSESMETNGLTTTIALRMLAVGEKSGNMGEMMERIAEFHDEEISRWIDWFVRLFEPLLMAAIGLVIGAIVILMYMPIFELAGSLK